MRRASYRGGWLARGPWLGTAVAAMLLSAACSEGPGEDRPNVEVIGGGGSVSVSGVVEGYGEPLYFPVTDQTPNLAIGLDLRAMRVLMSAAARNEAVDWPAVLTIYEDGQNQTGSGPTRALGSLARDAYPGVFPNGAAVFGRDGFIDGIIRDALTGDGRAAGLGDNARRQIVDRGVQMLQYGLAMASLQDAQALMDAGSAPEAGAAIDAGWAALAGAREGSMPNDGLLATALAREEEFVLAGRLARPLEAHLFQALVASQQGDAAGFREALDASRGYLNTIFYLSVLRDAKVLAGDSRATDRETHLAEGWTFFQTLRAQVAAVSPGAADSLEGAFTRDPDDAFAADLTEAVYAALNEAAVLQALEIPAEFQFQLARPMTSATSHNRTAPGHALKRRALLTGAMLAVTLLAAGCTGDDGEEVITVYVGRSQTLVEPLLNQFAETSGIRIRVRYGDGTDLVLGILEEGANSQVDVYYGQDVGALGALKQEGLLAPLRQEILDRVEPGFRSPEGLWVGISGRSRVIVYNTDAVDPATLPASILDYTDPKWNGKIGIVPRSDGFPEFVTALRVVRGDDFALRWLKDLKANTPRTYPNNIAALQAVANREIEVAFLNHYYLYRFLAERGEGFKARNYFFDNGDLGGLFLVSSAAVLKSSDHQAAAQTFVEFLLSEEAQQYFADHDYEYPVAGEASPDEALPPIETLKAPDIDLSDLGDLRGSLELMRAADILP